MSDTERSPWDERLTGDMSLGCAVIGVFVWLVTLAGAFYLGTVIR